MAPLPNFRVQESPPFSKVGVDFAEPLYVKGLKGKTRKMYITLFSCCVTRALHLELVEDLTAQSFLRCLRRLTARRGTPELIVSDNAKKAAAKSINRIFRNKDVQREFESRRIEWKFNLERSPWWGGMFERMVGLVKRILRKILGNALLNKDEMHTVLVEVEGILNSRPLTYIYEDEFNVDILTPSHLMFGRRLSPFADHIEFNYSDDETSHSKRFLYLVRKLQHFWKRWRTEYLRELREKHNAAGAGNCDIHKGDIVLIEDGNVKRSQWKIGRIERLIVGKDGNIRGASVVKICKGK